MELHTGYRKQNATFSEIIGEEEIIGTDCYSYSSYRFRQKPT